MKKLVIIPAFNEEESIVNVINDIKQNAKTFDYIIINDCSKDNTISICKKNNFNYLDLPVNLGIGGAVQAGYMYAKKYGYDIAVQFDGDGQHDAKFLDKLYECLEKENLDMVIGSRFIKKQGFQSSSIRRVGIKFFTLLIKCLFGKGITDATSGMRMCNKKVIDLFAEDYPRDYPEPESVCRLLKEDFNVKEIDVIMRDRQAGTSSISIGKSVYYMVKVSLAILVEKIR